MPVKSVRAASAILISTAIGCQDLHSLSKYDPLIRRQTPQGDVQLASATSRASVLASDAGPGASKVHFVGYAPGDASAAGASANAAAGNGAAGSGAAGSGANGVGENGAGATISLLPANVASAPKPSWLSAESSGLSGKSWNDLFVTRGQGPLRDVFVSDRALMAAVIVAAIVIPFAIHDSRQPNPPHQ